MQPIPPEAHGLGRGAVPRRQLRKVIDKKSKQMMDTDINRRFLGDKTQQLRLQAITLIFI